MTADTGVDLENTPIEEEVEVLQSIYPECVSSQGYKPGEMLNLEIPVKLGRPRTVLITKSTETHNGGQNSMNDPRDSPTSTTIQLSHLPPLLLSIAFPPEYPSSSPPSIMSLKSTHSWIAKTTELRQALLKLWAEEETVLCQWVEFIYNGDFLDEIGLVDSDDNIRCVIFVFLLLSRECQYLHLAYHTRCQTTSHLFSQLTTHSAPQLPSPRPLSLVRFA